MEWKTRRTNEFNDWWETLGRTEQRKVGSSIEELKRTGPWTGRPLVDTVKGSRYPNMKELRVGRTVRVFFAFDPSRTAALLIGGDKAGETKRFYPEMIPRADAIYDRHLQRIERRPENG